MTNDSTVISRLPRTDYHLTSDFAKKLSMTGNSERHEQARDYFIACEQGLKIATNKLKSQQYNLEPLFDAITTLTQTIASMQQDISSIKESSQKKKLPEKKYSRWKTNTFSKLNTLTQYVNENSDQTLQLKDTIHITINELEDTYNIELSDYVQAYKSEFNLETEPYVIDVISHYKDLDNLSICLSDGLGHQVYYYTERGIMEICRWSNSKKANQFMDWAWDIIESYRNNTLSSQNIDMKAFTDILTSLSNT